MKTLCLCAISVWIFCGSCLAQNINSKLEKTRIPNFDVHLSASLKNGIRLGGRYYLLKSISVEASYGYSLDVFGGGDGGKFYELGLNYFPVANNSFLVSLLGLYNVRNEGEKYVISPCIGFLFPRDTGLEFLARFGLNIEKYKDLNKVTPNFEVGIGIAF